MTTLAGFSVAAIELAWAKGNDAGDGFAWTAAERRGATRLGTTGDSDADLTVWRRADGSMVGVGDAHGPWAVVLDMPDATS